MGILVAAGDGFDVDLFAANFLSEGGEVGGGRHDTKFAVRTARSRADESEDEGASSKNRADSSSHFCASHDISEAFLKTALERVCAMRAHDEQKLEEKFVGIRSEERR